MKAMLLAAGLGTRLRPLTLHTPKPLIPVNGIPLIFYNLALLKKFGIKHVVINLHHLGEQIENVLGSGRKFGFQFKYSYEPQILGTGGGIKKAQRLFQKGPFIVLNGDIIVDINLKELLQFHKKRKGVATLVVKSGPQVNKFGALYLNKGQEILSILTPPKVKDACSRALFAGIHVLEEKALNLLPANKPLCIIRDGYIPWIEKGEKINGFFLTRYWNDLGTLNRLGQTEKEVKKGVVTFSYQKELLQLRKAYFAL